MEWNHCEFEKYGSHYEIRINSRSSITVIFGKTTCGGFACMPDFGAGCHLVDLKDRFWNTEQLTKVLGKVDGVTVSTALCTLATEFSFRLLPLQKAIYRRSHGIPQVVSRPAWECLNQGYLNDAGRNY